MAARRARLIAAEQAAATEERGWRTAAFVAFGIALSLLLLALAAAPAQVLVRTQAGRALIHRRDEVALVGGALGLVIGLAYVFAL